MSTRADVMSVQLEHVAEESSGLTEEHGKKRVRFMEENNPPFTPLAKAIKHKKQNKSKLYESIRELWERQIDAGNEAHLRRTLQQFYLGEEKLVDFLKQEGRALLTFALLFRNGTEHLKFICDYIPAPLLKEILREKNYDSLQSLLLGNTGVEKKGQFNEERRIRVLAKVKLLLNIDANGLENYMQSDFFKKYYTPGVQACFRQAVEEHRQECKSTIKL